MDDGDGADRPADDGTAPRQRRPRGQARLPTRRTALATLGTLGAGLAVAGTLWDGLGLEGPDSKEPMALVPASAATHRAVRSGRWDDPAVWEGEAVPGDGARVLIESDVDLTLAHEEQARHETVRVDGRLAVDPAVDTHLRVDTLVTAPGSTFHVGTADEPVEAGATARLTFVDNGPIDEDWDPDRRSRGLLALGDVAVHGAETTSWTPLVTHPTAGDSSITLAEAPTNWRAGDEIVVPGLEPNENHDEERTVAGVDGATVRLETPLASDHVPPVDDLDAYACKLSRNVVFASESTDVSRRGHVMVLGQASRFRYLEARELGRTDKTRAFTDPPGGRGEPARTEPPNPRARYALHLHRTGPAGDRHVIEGCAVRGSPGWGVVNHESHADVLDCVTYRVTGAGIVAEKGNEVGRFAGNFALRSAGSGEFVDDRELLVHNRTGKVHDPPNNVDDFGHGGHGFWMQSPAVEVTDNVAAGHRHHGFVYWNRSLVEDPGPDAEETLQSRRDMVPDFPVELATDAERRAARVDEETGLAFSSDFPIRRFESNTCFACAGGMDFSRQQFRDSHFRYDEWGTIEDFTVYNVGKFETADGERVGPTGGAKSSGNVAVDARLCANLAIRDCRFFGTGDGTAVWRSFPYTDSILVEDCEIAGWAVGVVPPQFNGNNMAALVRDNDFDNDVDVRIHGRFSGDVAIEGNTFADGGTAGVKLEDVHPANASPGRIATVDTGVQFDGRTVYHDVSDPDAVFVPDEDFASRLKNSGRWAEDRFLGEDPSALVGMTTREIYEEYEITIRGGVTPPEATAHPQIEGGTVGPKSSTKTQPTDEVWVDFASPDGATGEDFEAVSDDMAAGGRALALTKPDRSHEDPPRTDQEMATYRFQLSDGGLYHMEARMGATSHNGSREDSIWIRIDGGEWHRWYNVTGRYMWHRYRLTGHSSGTQQPGHDLRFEPGVHTVDVGARGVEVFLDTFLVRHATNGATAIAEGRPPTE